MDALKKWFPLSFKFTKSVSNFIVGVLVYVIVAAVAGLVNVIFAKMPLIGLIIGIVCDLVYVYMLFGIVILFLVYFKVLKD